MFLLRWAFAFAVLALIAGVLRFGGLAEGFADIALFLFYLFLGGLILFMVLGMFAYNKVTGPPNP
jgi:uncharacterized membrane protein YtjA (UPF0391 family)